MNSTYPHVKLIGKIPEGLSLDQRLINFELKEIISRLIHEAGSEQTHVVFATGHATGFDPNSYLSCLEKSTEKMEMVSNLGLALAPPQPKGPVLIHLFYGTDDLVNAIKKAFFIED